MSGFKKFLKILSSEEKFCSALTSSKNSEKEYEHVLKGGINLK